MGALHNDGRANDSVISMLQSCVARLHAISDIRKKARTRTQGEYAHAYMGMSTTVVDEPMQACRVNSDFFFVQNPDGHEKRNNREGKAR